MEGRRVRDLNGPSHATAGRMARRLHTTGSAADFLPARKMLPALRAAAAGCRGCDLYKRGLIPRDQYDTAELNVKTQEAQIRSSEAGLVQSKSQLNSAEVNLGHTVIRENHVGDWGTPFGMTIENLIDIGESQAASELSVGSDIDRLCRGQRPRIIERKRACTDGLS